MSRFPLHNINDWLRRVIYAQRSHHNPKQWASTSMQWRLDLENNPRTCLERSFLLRSHKEVNNGRVIDHPDDDRSRGSYTGHCMLAPNRRSPNTWPANLACSVSQPIRCHAAHASADIPAKEEWVSLAPSRVVQRARVMCIAVLRSRQ